MSSRIISSPLEHGPRHRENASTFSFVLSQQEVSMPASVLTLAGFRAWVKSECVPEHAKVAFIDREIVIEMSGEEIQAHGIVKIEVSSTTYRLCKEHDLGVFLPDGVLVTNETAKVSNIPDAVLATWPSLDAGRVHLLRDEKRTDRYLELVGTPDWVLEIVSDSSVRKDTKLLREGYHRAGIPEYWLIDARGDEIDFRILLHEPTGYVDAPIRAGWQRSPVFGRRFRLERKRGRLDYWQYTLEAKPAR